MHQIQLRKGVVQMITETWGRCGSLGFQAAAEEPVFAMCWCIVDDVGVGVWELIFYLLPRVFGMFVKRDVNWIDVTNCVKSTVVRVSNLHL